MFFRRFPKSKSPRKAFRRAKPKGATLPTAPKGDRVDNQKYDMVMSGGHFHIVKDGPQERHTVAKDVVIACQILGIYYYRNGEKDDRVSRETAQGCAAVVECFMQKINGKLAPQSDVTEQLELLDKGASVKTNTRSKSSTRPKKKSTK